MLKIRDNVDLKELENYGYNNKYSDDYEKVIGYGETIWVENNTRNIWLESSMSYFDEEKFIEPVIQDLIKADLVEKVGDE